MAAWILTGSVENFRINVERGFDVHVAVLNHQPIVYAVDPRIVFHSSAPMQAAFAASDAGSMDDELEQITPVKKNGGDSCAGIAAGRGLWLRPRRVAKLVNARDLKSLGGDPLQVRFLPRAS